MSEETKTETEDEAAKRKTASAKQADLVKDDPRKRLCSIEQMLTATIIKMLSAAPENAVNRTMALAVLKKPIPDDCKSWEAIKDWVEYNFKPPESGFDGFIKKISSAAPSLALPYNASRRESGTCNYTRRMSRSANVIFGEHLIDIWLQRAAEEDLDWGEFIEMVRSETRNHVIANPPQLAPEPSQTSSYNASDTSELVVDASSNTLADRLYDWLNTYRANQLRDIEDR